MHHLSFVQPTLAHKEAVLKFRQDFLVKLNKTAIAGSSHLESFDENSYQEWLDYVYAPAGTNRFGYDKVESRNYLAMLDNKAVGIVNIRHELTAWLLKVGGHVGYSTHPDYHGQGIVTAMLAFALKELTKLGITKALITCDDTNIASAKVIEKNGGVLENKIDVLDKTVRRYWIEL